MKLTNQKILLADVLNEKINNELKNLLYLPFDKDTFTKIEFIITKYVHELCLNYFSKEFCDWLIQEYLHIINLTVADELKYLPKVSKEFQYTLKHISNYELVKALKIFENTIFEKSISLELQSRP